MAEPPYAEEVGFGTRLADARKAKGLSQEALGKALAELLGEPESDKSKKQGVSHWENDRFQPSIEQLAGLCDILDCSADWLILGRSPEHLPIEAIIEARFFNKLSPAGKKRWRAMRPVFVDAVPDHHLEERMPAVATKPKERQ